MPPSRIQITEDGDLHFEKIIHKIGISRSVLDSSVYPRHGKNYTDEGEYRCVVKSAIGVVFSPVITVSVAVLEVQDGNKEEVKVKAGQPALLQCQIASTPPLTSSHVTWVSLMPHGRTNNISRLAQETNRFSILTHSGTLVIFSVQSGDAGNYRCFARHDVLNTNKSADVKLIVETANELVSSEPPKFLFANDYETQKTIILDEEDEEQTLDCIASGIPVPTITWVLTYEVANESESDVQPFSKILSEGKEYHDSITLTSENSIQGNYTCVITNSIGSPISKTIQVVRLPALIKGPNSYKYPPAKTVRFECKVPPTYTLIWYKDGQRLETGKGRVKAKGNEIVISNTIRNDSGFYQCEVVSEDHIYAIGTARLSVENNREAPDAPFDLQCIQSQAKALVISWKVASRDNITAFTIHYMAIGGEERQKVTPSKSNDFIIENLKAYTNYSIYVRSYSVKSASAQSQKVICSTLEDTPIKAPRNFIFERYGPASQVRIRWRPLSDSEARGKITLYKLQWRSVNGEFTNVRYIDGDSDEFLITELTPGEPIELRLLPSTSAGWPSDKENSPWTRVNTTKLEANVTDDYYAPPTMDLTVLNSSSILVNWSEPPRHKDLSLKGYRLTYSTEVGKIEDFVFFGPIHTYNYSDRSYLFTNFAPSTSYEVHLQTFGDSWESEVVSKFIRTFSTTSNEDSMSSSKVLPTISGLQVIPTSSSEVRLTWEPPKNSQLHYYYYTVRYNKLDHNDYQYISSTSESIEIKDLKPYTSYEFSVQLMGDDEGGPYSQKIESRTLPGIPGSPIQLHWRVLNQTLVEVEWQPPPATNGVILKYWVQYRHKNASLLPQGVNNGGVNDTSWKNKLTKNTSVFLEDLLKNEEYMVRIIAETKAGVGNPSETIYVRIFIRKPTSPEALPPGDSPPATNTLQTVETSSQHLGIVIGIGLSVLFIIVCVIIILSRHRLFPMLTRQPVGMHVNGNGFPPRAKRSVESFNGVEMKVLESLTANDQQLDTKGGHSHQNGIIPAPTDPLLMRIVRNPIDDPHGREDEETVPNCIH
ncbi:protogenin isoform X2 [Folsomia candida]|nr:protogenin isoform X2 [Folsomia candida]